MQEWLNFSSSFTNLLILLLVEFFVVSYFFVRNPEYRRRIFQIALYSGIIATLVAFALLIISHFEGTFLSIIIAVFVVPLAAALLACMVYIGLALFSFVHSFFTPTKDKPENQSSMLESIAVGAIGIIVAIKIINLLHHLEAWPQWCGATFSTLF